MDAAGSQQFVQAAHAYAAQYQTRFPDACRESLADAQAGANLHYGHDDMVAFRYPTWVILRDHFGLTTDNTTCICFDWQAKSYGRQDTTTYGGTVLGRIIWGNRRDTFPGLFQSDVYKTPKRTSDQGTSNTYLTCRAFVRAPTWYNGVIPHVDGDRWDYTENGITDPYEFSPMPEWNGDRPHRRGRLVYFMAGPLSVRTTTGCTYDPLPTDPRMKYRIERVRPSMANRNAPNVVGRGRPGRNADLPAGRLPMPGKVHLVDAQGTTSIHNLWNCPNWQQSIANSQCYCFCMSQPSACICSTKFGKVFLTHSMSLMVVIPSATSPATAIVMTMR